MNKKLLSIGLGVLVLVVVLIIIFQANWFGEEPARYPSRDVTIIIPWSAGGMTDTLVRPIASWLSEYFEIPFVVENMPGGGGVVGSLEIEKAETDGYTIGTTSISTLTARYVAPVYPNIENVELIAQVITIPATLTVRADSPWETLEEYIEYAKANPEKIKSANSGIGASAHVYTVIFEEKAGIKSTRVPFPAYAEAITALLGGHVDSTNIPLPDVIPHVQAGDLRLLAIASAERHPDFPDVPTFREKGIDFVMGNYTGFVAPKGFSREQIEVLENAIRKALEDPEINEFLLDAGYQPHFLGAEDFRNSVEAIEAELYHLVNVLGISLVDD